MHGISVTDFLAHTAGSMPRTTQGGKRHASWRDFASVFQNGWAVHLFIDVIRCKALSPIHIPKHPNS